jgi:nicotinate-nucleotide pyrophosphorylase (carboxylating)
MAPTPTQQERDNLRRLLEQARSEDLGGGDLTSAILPGELRARAQFVSRQELVFCGGCFLQAIAAAYDTAIATRLKAAEGEPVGLNAVLAEWSGPLRSILSTERVALNFLQRLSGVATATRGYVQAVAGTAAGIYDTRKTIPGWRELDKYAVRAGGGRNHRQGLYDAALIKDNHLAGLALATGQEPLEALRPHLRQLRSSLPAGGFIELEVDDLEQLARALKLDVDMILLDNMSPDQLRQAVALRDQADLKGKVELEASGGITLATVRAVAQAGVERISVGALTHSAPAVDIALDLNIK